MGKRLWVKLFQFNHKKYKGTNIRAKKKGFVLKKDFWKSTIDEGVTAPVRLAKSSTGRRFRAKAQKWYAFFLQFLRLFCAPAGVRRAGKPCVAGAGTTTDKMEELNPKERKG